jgi:phosphomannomutase/phosphoglucomutase
VKSTGTVRDGSGAARKRREDDYWKTGHSYIKRRVAELKAHRWLRKVGTFLLQPADRARL